MEAKYATEFIFYRPLVTTGALDYKSNPTLAAGDFQVSTDGSAWTNLDTLPSLSPAADNQVKFTVSVAEMTGKQISVRAVDAAGDEWEDDWWTIETYGHASAQHVFDRSQATPDVNVSEISSDSTAADNLEAQFDGTGYEDDTGPATQAQLSQIANVGAAVNTPAESYALTTGSQLAGTYASTSALDGTEHQHDDDGGAMDLYYQFDVGGDGVPTSVVVTGRINGSNDDLDGIYAYNWGGTSWDRIGDFDGQVSSTNVVRSFDLFTSHVGTGANLGKVRIRFYASAGLSSADLYVDQLFVSYAIVRRSVGYAQGAIWVDSAGTSGTEVYVNGTADNPCPWADAIVIAAALGLNKFEIAGGNTVTLGASADGYTLNGEGWDLALGGQSISGLSVSGAGVTGVGVEGASSPHFHHCDFGAVTIPPADFHDCGFGVASGAFTAGGDGDYVLHNCFSQVPGSGSPSFDFSGLGAATGINNRSWTGGATWTLDSDCTLSHEVVAGGGTTVATGGANVEIRGVTRSITLTVSGAGTVQFVGITGPIAISGTATTTVNLYGVSSSLTDTSSNTTVSDETTSQDNVRDSLIDDATRFSGADVAAILADTADMQPKLGTPSADLAADIAAVTAPTVGEIDTELTSNHGSGSWAATAGGGAYSVVIATKEADLTPISNVAVSIYTDSARTNLFASVDTGVTGSADAIGMNAAQYYWAAAKAGTTFTSGSFTISAGSTETLTGTVISVTAPSQVDGCTVYGDLADIGGTAVQNTVTASAQTPTELSGWVYVDDDVTAVADSNGRWELELKQGANVRLDLPDTRRSGVYTIPATSTAAFVDLVRVS